MPIALRRRKTTDLLVRKLTKFKLAINRKTAKELRLTIPTSLLATADILIE
jgi:ABC-type uncharacterized transport system substrate-binding protein